ncbi:ribonuclease II [Leifsonia sp. Root227]|uniref:RNB domain-containing ribonuclease n=1 Tax=Leifsonia sp. Root227 TaxID=1736496 RepID=UPI0006F52069|nr:RNB domain-containing ribonuclease [Leifsonia sp. Root227]KRC50547.1 ribonuclease II [Leifsonia sp. Root227]
MPDRRTHVTASAAQSELATALAELRTALSLPDGFPAPVDREAEAAASTISLPDRDLTAVEFLTVDPVGSTDLDQAVHIERAGAGFLVRYAIADVPALVRPGGAVDTEARTRGQTVYAADGRIPLHPAAIGEHAGSLLPGVDRGAFVWELTLGEDGQELAVSVARAGIRSRRQWSYQEAQAAIDDGSGPETLLLLREVGLLRIQCERERGGASLNAPDEEIVFRDGAYTLERRASLPVEEWNAQISLLTGMAAARLMLDARVGILRTMPPPTDDAVAAFRAQTTALGLPWPQDVSYGEYLRTLDHHDPRALAVMQAATGLFRGAGYVVMDGTAPADPLQSAVAAPYAHTTAPLRRLVDRWVLVICEALCAGRTPPEWATASLGELPAIMGATSRVASQLGAASVDRVEAALLSGRIGDEFDATVLAIRNGDMTVQLADPAVVASMPRPDTVLPGTVVRVRLLSVSIPNGKVELVAV